jgi:hypothetical protein
MHRIRYTITNETSALEVGIGFLERYFTLIAFCAYINEGSKTNFELSYSKWLSKRPELVGMLENLSKKGPSLFPFRPVEDLSVLNTKNNEFRRTLKVQTDDSFALVIKVTLVFQINLESWWCRSSLSHYS